MTSTAVPVLVNLRSIGVPFAWWRAQALRLEAAGYAGVAAWDHFVSRGARTDPVLEAWTTLAAVGGATTRLGLMTFVANVMNRHPAVLARMAATLQDATDGRLVLGIGTGIRTGEIVIATAASPFDGTTATYLHGEPYAPAADFSLTRALVDAAEAAGAAYQVGPICTVDVFYNPDADYFSRWAARGVLAFEMESSALFYLAARARATGADVRAATILTVSDVLGEGVTSEQSYLPLDELERRTATTLQVALAAATSPAVTAGL